MGDPPGGPGGFGGGGGGIPGGGGGGGFDGNLIIPEGTIIISDIYMGRTDITSVKIPASVTTISAKAFLGCTNIITLEFDPSSNLTSIGDYAFYGCPSINTGPDFPTGATQGDFAFGDCPNSGATGNIVFSDEITHIQPYAYIGVAAITSVTIPSSVTSIGEGAFFGCTGLTSVYFSQAGSDLITIGELAFYNCSNLASFTIPPAVTIIRPKAFANNTSLTTVTIVHPSSLETIEELAFSNCTSLTTIDIPTSVSSIGGGAFSGCTQMATAIFDEPATCTEIAHHTFQSCTALTSFTIPSSVEVINNYAFNNCSSLRTVFSDVSSSLQSILGNAFGSCVNLLSILLPNTLVYIDDEVFNGCFCLSSLTFPASITAIGSGNSIVPMFNDCTSLTTVTFNGPSSLTSINSTMFQGSTSITTINIPASITEISSQAFSNCTALKTITFDAGSSVQTIGDSTFSNCTALTSINLPASLSSLGNSAFSGCSSLTAVGFDVSSALTSLNIGTFQNCSALTSFTCPSSIQTIQGNVFYNCTALRTFVSSPSIQTIDSSALIGCSALTTITLYGYIPTDLLSGLPLTTVIIGAGVTEIPANAFSDCSGLTSLQLPNSITVIGAGAFYRCSGLTVLRLPDSITTIGDGAFYGCRGLTTINIPAALTTIGDIPFNGCTALATVTCAKTSSLTTINTTLFQDCSESLVSIAIPPSVVTIEPAAFQYCTSLSSVIIDASSSLVTIGGSAFLNCTALKSFHIPASVTDIGANAFQGCSLSTVTFDASAALVTIGDGAFLDCSGLTSFQIPASVTTIGNAAFNHCTALLNIFLSNTVTSVGSVAFGGNPELCVTTNHITSTLANSGIINLVIDNSITTFPSEMIANSIFPSVTIGTGITSLPENAFLNCDVMSVSFGAPSSITTIPANTFVNCRNLNTIILPSSVTSFDPAAIDASSNRLQTLVVTNYALAYAIIQNYTAYPRLTGCVIQAPYIYINVLAGFFGRTLGSLGQDGQQQYIFNGPLDLTNVSDAVTDMWNFLTPSNLTQFAYPRNLATAISIGFHPRLSAIIFPYNCTRIECFIGETSIQSISIPSSVTQIAAGAFENSRLNEIILLSGMTEISAFICKATPITSVTIPDTVTKIADQAFMNCTKLETVIFESIVNITDWGTDAFRNTPYFNSLAASHAPINLAHSVVTVETGNQIQLTWSRPPNILPHFITGYNVYIDGALVGSSISETQFVKIVPFILSSVNTISVACVLLNSGEGARISDTYTSPTPSWWYYFLDNRDAAMINIFPGASGSVYLNRLGDPFSQANISYRSYGIPAAPPSNPYYSNGVKYYYTPAVAAVSAYYTQILQGWYAQKYGNTHLPIYPGNTKPFYREICLELIPFFSTPSWTPFPESKRSIQRVLSWILMDEQVTANTNLAVNPDVYLISLLPNFINVQPPALENVTVGRGYLTIGVNWQPPNDMQGITGYKVYFNDLSFNTVGPSFSYYTLSQNTSYTLQVAAVNIMGVEGTRSSVTFQSNTTLPSWWPLETDFPPILQALPNASQYDVTNRLQNVYSLPIGPSATLFDCLNYYAGDLPGVNYQNYITLAWIANDMRLSTDTATRNQGIDALVRYLPYARSISRILDFNDGGADASLNYIPTGYFTDVSDGSILYPPTVQLTHSKQLIRIDPAAFGIIRQVSINNGPVYAVSNGNIQVAPTNGVHMVDISGVKILVSPPPSGGIAFPLGIPYYPPGYFNSVNNVYFSTTNLDFTTNDLSGCQFPSAKIAYFPLFNDKDLVKLLPTTFNSNGWDGCRINIGGTGLYTSIQAKLTPTLSYSTFHDYGFWMNYYRNANICIYGGVVYENYPTNPHIWYVPQLLRASILTIPANTLSLSSHSRAFRAPNINRLNIESSNNEWEVGPSINLIRQDTETTINYSGINYVVPHYHIRITDSMLVPPANPSSLTGHIKLLNSANFDSVPPFVTSLDPTKLTAITIPACIDICENFTFPYNLVYYYNNFKYRANGTETPTQLAVNPNTTEITLRDRSNPLGPYMMGAATSTIVTIEWKGALLKNIPDNAFNGCINLQVMNIPILNTIGVSAFQGCRSLPSLDLNLSTSLTISANAYASCTGMTFLKLKTSGDLTIGATAFNGCTALTTITIECAGTLTLNSTAFNGCTSVTRVQIINKNANTVINQTPIAFNVAGMLNLESFELDALRPYTLADIRTLTKLKDIKINSPSVKLQPRQFLDCSAIEIINISNIVDGSLFFFNNFSKLQSVTLRGSNLWFVNIMNRSDLPIFYNCPVLQTVNITGINQTIVEGSFTQCPKLSTIQLVYPSNSVQTVNANISSQPSLTTVSITGGTNVTATQFLSDSSANLTTLKLDRLTGALGSTTSFPNLTTLSLGHVTTLVNLSKFPNLQNLAVSYTSPTAIAPYQFKDNTRLIDVSMSNITDIGTGAFFGCTNLTKFNFPSGMTKVGDWAFANTALTGAFTIPATVTYLGVGYFIKTRVTDITYLCDVIRFDDPTRISGEIWSTVDDVTTRTYTITGKTTITGGFSDASTPAMPYTDLTTNTVRTVTSPSVNVDLQTYTNLIDSFQTTVTHLQKAFNDVCGNSTGQGAIAGVIELVQAAATELITNKQSMPTLDVQVGWNSRTATFVEAQAIVDSLNYPNAKTALRTAGNSFIKVMLNNTHLPKQLSGQYMSVPNTIPIPSSSFSITLPSSSITHIEGDNDVDICNNKLCVVWKGQTTILLTDNTQFDISGTVVYDVAAHLGSQLTSILTWILPKMETLIDGNNVKFNFDNKQTIIRYIDYNTGGTISIKSSFVVIQEFGMRGFTNGTLTIAADALYIHNNAFSQWNTSKLDITMSNLTGNDIYPGIDIFMDSENVTVDSNQFLINQPIVKMAPIANSTLTDVPALILTHTGVNGVDALDVCFDTYIPENNQGYTRSLPMISFQHRKTLRKHIIIAQPEDWFWCYRANPNSQVGSNVTQLPSPKRTSGTINYMRNTNISYVWPKADDPVCSSTGLTSAFAPNKFSYCGYIFTRIDTPEAPLTNSTVKLHAVKTNNGDAATAIAGIIGQNTFATAIIDILIGIFTVIVAGLVASASALIPVVGVAIGGILANVVLVQGALLALSVNNQLTTGSFTLGNNITVIVLSVVGAVLLGGHLGVFFNMAKAGANAATNLVLKFAASTVARDVVKIATPIIVKSVAANTIKSAAKSTVKNILGNTLGNIARKATKVTFSNLQRNAITKVNLGKLIKSVAAPAPLAVEKAAVSFQIKVIKEAVKFLPIVSGIKSVPAVAVATVQRNAVKNIAQKAIKVATSTSSNITKVQAQGIFKTGAATNVGQAISQSLQKATQIAAAQVRHVRPINVAARSTWEKQTQSGAKYAMLRAHTVVTLTLQEMKDAYFYYMYLDDPVDYSSADDYSTLISILTPENPMLADINNISLQQLATHTIITTQPSISCTSNPDNVGTSTQTDNVIVSVPLLIAGTMATQVDAPPYIPQPGRFYVPSAPSDSPPPPGEYSAYPYQIQYYQTQGTNYETIPLNKSYTGYPCQVINEAGPLHLMNNYLWKGTYLGGPTAPVAAEINISRFVRQDYINNGMGVSVKSDCESELYLGRRDAVYVGSGSSTYVPTNIDATATIVLAAKLANAAINLRSETPNYVYSGGQDFTINIREGITAIPNNAFASTDCKDGTVPFSIENVKLSDSVINIGSNAFYRTTLKNFYYTKNTVFGANCCANSGLTNLILKGDYFYSYSGQQITGVLEISLNTNTLITYNNARVNDLTQRNTIIFANVKSATLQGTKIANDGSEITIVLPSYSDIGIYRAKLFNLGSNTSDASVWPYIINANASGSSMPNGQSWSIQGGTVGINLYNINTYTQKSLTLTVSGTGQTFITTVPYTNDAKNTVFDITCNDSTSRFCFPIASSITVKGGSDVGLLAPRTLRPRTLINGPTIGYGAFAGCESLQNITIAPGTTDICDNAFADTPNLGPVVLPEGLVTIGNGAFAGSSITQLTLSSTVQSVGDNLFGDVSSGINIVMAFDPTDNAAFSQVMSQVPEGSTVWTTPTFSESVTTALGDISNVTVKLDVPPNQVVGLSAIEGDGSVTLSWTAADTSGSQVISYTIDISGDTVFEASSTTTSYVVNNLKNRTAYTFSVYAVNQNGLDGPDSLSVTATPVPPLPAQPYTNLIVTDVSNSPFFATYSFFLPEGETHALVWAHIDVSANATTSISRLYSKPTSTTYSANILNSSAKCSVFEPAAVLNDASGTLVFESNFNDVSGDPTFAFVDLSDNTQYFITVATTDSQADQILALSIQTLTGAAIQLTPYKTGTSLNPVTGLIASSDASLQTFTVNDIAITSDSQSLTVRNQTSISVVAVPNDSDATVDICGNTDLAEGHSQVSVIVTATDGTTQSSHFVMLNVTLNTLSDATIIDANAAVTDSNSTNIGTLANSTQGDIAAATTLADKQQVVAALLENIETAPPTTRVAILINTAFELPADADSDDLTTTFNQALEDAGVVPNVPYDLSPDLIPNLLNSIPAGELDATYNPTSMAGVLPDASTNTLVIDFSRSDLALMIVPGITYTVTALDPAGNASTDSHSVVYTRSPVARYVTVDGIVNEINAHMAFSFASGTSYYLEWMGFGKPMGRRGTPDENPICFLGNAPILTPTGYRRIDTLKVGDLVTTADGRTVAIQKVARRVAGPGPNSNPYIIPTGLYGATQTLAVSPMHRIMTDKGLIESKMLGLKQMPMRKTWTYYNLMLPSWTTDNLVVAGVTTESLASVTRIRVSPASFKYLLAKSDLQGKKLLKLLNKCVFYKDGTIEVPVTKTK